MSFIDPIQTPLNRVVPQKTETPGIENGFGEFLAQAMEQNRNVQARADQAVETLVSGEGGNLHEVMLAMEEADLSMRLLVQVRNKVVEAYHEIMQMQV